MERNQIQDKRRAAELAVLTRHYGFSDGVEAHIEETGDVPDGVVDVIETLQAETLLVMRSLGAFANLDVYVDADRIQTALSRVAILTADDVRFVLMTLTIAGLVDEEITGFRRANLYSLTREGAR